VSDGHLDQLGAYSRRLTPRPRPHLWWSERTPRPPRRPRRPSSPRPRARISGERRTPGPICSRVRLLLGAAEGRISGEATDTFGVPWADALIAWPAGRGRISWWSDGHSPWEWFSSSPLMRPRPAFSGERRTPSAMSSWMLRSLMRAEGRISGERRDTHATPARHNVSSTRGRGPASLVSGRTHLFFWLDRLHVVSGGRGRISGERRTLNEALDGTV